MGSRGYEKVKPRRLLRDKRAVETIPFKLLIVCLILVITIPTVWAGFESYSSIQVENDLRTDINRIITTAKQAYNGGNGTSFKINIDVRESFLNKIDYIKIGDRLGGDSECIVWYKFSGGNEEPIVVTNPNIPLTNVTNQPLILGPGRHTLLLEHWAVGTESFVVVKLEGEELQTRYFDLDFGWDQPDLAVTNEDIQLLRTYVDENDLDTIEITVTIRNIGVKDAKSFNVLLEDKYNGDVVNTMTQRISSLKAGSEATITVTWQLDFGHTVYVYVDSGNEISERTADNNEAHTLPYNKDSPGVYVQGPTGGGGTRGDIIAENYPDVEVAHYVENATKYHACSGGYYLTDNIDIATDVILVGGPLANSYTEDLNMVTMSLGTTYHWGYNINSPTHKFIVKANEYYEWLDDLDAGIVGTINVNSDGKIKTNGLTNSPNRDDWTDHWDGTQNKFHTEYTLQHDLDFYHGKNFTLIWGMGIEGTIVAAKEFNKSLENPINPINDPNNEFVKVYHDTALAKWFDKEGIRDYRWNYEKPENVEFFKKCINHALNISFYDINVDEEFIIQLTTIYLTKNIDYSLNSIYHRGDRFKAFWLWVAESFEYTTQFPEANDEVTFDNVYQIWQPWLKGLKAKIDSEIEIDVQVKDFFRKNIDFTLDAMKILSKSFRDLPSYSKEDIGIKIDNTIDYSSGIVVSYHEKDVYVGDFVRDTGGSLIIEVYLIFDLIENLDSFIFIIEVEYPDLGEYKDIDTISMKEKITTFVSSVGKKYHLMLINALTKWEVKAIDYLAKVFIQFPFLKVVGFFLSIYFLNERINGLEDFFSCNPDGFIVLLKFVSLFIETYSILLTIAAFAWFGAIYLTTGAISSAFTAAFGTALIAGVSIGVILAVLFLIGVIIFAILFVWQLHQEGEKVRAEMGPFMTHNIQIWEQLSYIKIEDLQKSEDRYASLGGFFYLFTKLKSDKLSKIFLFYSKNYNHISEIYAKVPYHLNDAKAKSYDTILTSLWYDPDWQYRWIDGFAEGAKSVKVIYYEEMEFNATYYDGSVSYTLVNNENSYSWKREPPVGSEYYYWNDQGIEEWRQLPLREKDNFGREFEVIVSKGSDLGMGGHYDEETDCYIIFKSLDPRHDALALHYQQNSKIKMTLNEKFEKVPEFFYHYKWKTEYATISLMSEWLDVLHKKSTALKDSLEILINDFKEIDNIIKIIKTGIQIEVSQISPKRISSQDPQTIELSVKNEGIRDLENLWIGYHICEMSPVQIVEDSVGIIFNNQGHLAHGETKTMSASYSFTTSTKGHIYHTGWYYVVIGVWDDEEYISGSMLWIYLDFSLVPQLQGYVKYIEDNQIKPLEGVEVKVSWGLWDTRITYADANGKYQFYDLPNDITVTVEVLLTDGENIRIKDASNENSVAIKREDNVKIPSFGGTQRDFIIYHGHQSYAATMFKNAYDTVKFYTDTLGLDLDHDVPEDIYIFDDSTLDEDGLPSAWHEWSHGPWWSTCWIKMHTRFCDPTYPGARTDPDIIRHELSHHMMLDLYNYLPIRPGDKSHGGMNNQGTEDSLVEGWAEFMPCIIADSIGEEKPYLFEIRDIEYNYRWDDFNFSEEFAIAGILWDLYDDTSEAGDNVDLTIIQIWNVFVTANIYDSSVVGGGRYIDNARELYLAFRDSGLVTQSDLDELFELHGMPGGNRN